VDAISTEFDSARITAFQLLITREPPLAAPSDDEIKSDRQDEEAGSHPDGIL
jgi:hypothetical protein